MVLRGGEVALKGYKVRLLEGGGYRSRFASCCIVRRAGASIGG